ncbi:MAG: hypothetical protein HUU22_00880 [Phycisphaerae bacterium]|nr:hypothetical protein [Phycisphaerae bacterium]NUQ44569.1 hypothetical protein [Phycisphaerae bacterium]
MYLEMRIADRPPIFVRLKRRAITVGTDAAADVRIELPNRLDYQVVVVHDEGEWHVVENADAPAGRKRVLKQGEFIDAGAVRYRLRADADVGVRRCPSCGVRMAPPTVLCVACGLDLRSGRRVGPAAMPMGIAPPPASEAPAFSIATPREDTRLAFEHTPWKDRGAPLMTLVFGVAAIVAKGLLFPPSSPLAFSVGALLAWVFQTAGLVAVILLVNHWSGADFGSLHIGVLKCAAVAVLTLAVTTWTPELFELLAGPLPAFAAPLVQRVTLMFTLALAMIFPLLMVRYFFALDLYETMLVLAAQWLVSLIIAILLMLAM